MDVYVYSHKPISIGTSTFGMEASHSLHVPYGRVEEYASDENWKKYFNTIKEMPPRVGDYFTAKILKDDSSIKINARVVEENPFKVMLVSEDLTPIIPIDFSGGLTILGQIYGEDGLSFDVVEIGQHAFYACSDLETINIPRTVERIDKAFLSCGSLRSVTVHWINPSEIVVDTENFDGLPEDAVLYVPFGTSEQYAKIEVWNKFSQIIEFSFLYPRDIYIKPGATINLPLYLNNKEVMLGMQYRLTLPNGVLPIWENDGYMTSLTDRSKELTIISRKDPDSENGYLFAVLSLGGDSVIGNQGALLNIRVNVDKNMSPGEYKTELNDITLVTCSFDSFTPADVSSSFIVKDIMMGDVNADNYIDVADLAAQVQFILGADNINWIAYAGDMDESGEIEVNDYVALVNTILQQYYSTYMAQARNIGREEETTSLLRLSSLAIENGEEGDMCLSLVKDSVAYTALQFDLTLPAGISVVDDGTEAESRKHDVWYEKNLDGTYRVMCASMSNAEFSDGDILRLRIKADGAKQGIYEARIDNVVLSDVDAVRYTTGTARTQIQVGKNTGISELYKQGLHISIMNGNLILRAENAQRVQILLPNGLEIENLYMRDGEAKTLRLPKGIYIVNGKKINI